MLGPPETRSWRLAAIALILCGSIIALIFRLAQLQIVEHDKWDDEGVGEHLCRQTIPAPRGRIRDAAGYTLATTVAAYDIYVTPDTSRSPKEDIDIARDLARELDLSPEEILAALTKKTEEAILVKTRVCYDSGKKIAELRLPGVECVEKSVRRYPEGSLAAPLIGFVGKDREGLTGIEGGFDGELAGVDGTAIFEQGGNNEPIYLGFREVMPPEDGADLILTIDRFIQSLVEEELDKVIEEQSASGGTIIVMEPKTGAILGMASRPTFDLTEIDVLLHDSDDENFDDETFYRLTRNRAITDMYEPGSIFKIITMSAALEEKVVSPETTFYCEGCVTKCGITICTWDYQAHGEETMTEVLKNSCNVGATWVADSLGKEKFYEYVERFGFGQPTNIGLDGEADGQVRTPDDEDWHCSDLLTNSFGQGINITPLQMVTAVSAVANGGLLMRPMVVKEVIGPNESHTYEPEVVRRVISPETAHTLTDMLRQVVEDGGGILARVPGYHMAGKTGTADIPEQGSYASGGNIAGFCGFGPVEDPRFVILIKIDRPQDQWAGAVAAPVFKSIAQQLLVYLKIPPTEVALVQSRD